MGITAAIVVYAMLWFLTLFLVLPFRNRSQGEAGDVVPGTSPSAPEDAQMWKTARLVTIIAGVAFVPVAATIISGVIPMDIVERFIEVR